jgi:hypothetical protein
MRTKRLFYAALVISMGVALTSYADSPFSERDTRNNVAVAASPRARESFPWLTRTSGESAKYVAPGELKNAAYAKSPRALEVYPELARGSFSGSVGCANLPELVHPGYAASPRAKEMFPHLRMAHAALPSSVSCGTQCKCCG